MSNEEATGEELPEAVADWLDEVADRRGVSGAELLAELLRADGPDADGGWADVRRVERLESRLEELIEDLRQRVVQVKREADEKAPANHDHAELRSSVEQLAHEVGGVAAELEALDDRIADGFDNYEEILTYLTETTDELQEKVGRLAAAVVDLRERAGSAAREEARRSALAHLAGTANRHGVDRARCEACEETVQIGLLVEPRCPHCEASFSSLEPRRGFFRTSVLHTGSPPALESAPEEDPGGLVDDGPADLAELAARSDAEPSEAPSSSDRATGGPAAVGAGSAADWSDDASDSPAGGAAAAAGDGGAAARPAGTATAAAADSGGGTAGAVDDLQALDGVGPTYAERLAAAGVRTLRALADADADDVASAAGVAASTAADWIAQAEVLAGDPRDLDGVGPAYGDRLAAAGVSTLLDLAEADPEALGEAIDVPAATVADWVSQARARTAGS